MACLHKQTNNFKFLKKDYNERRLITKKKKIDVQNSNPPCPIGFTIDLKKREILILLY